MHTHRVHIFNGTDDDTVIRIVAHNFHFIFFPAQQRFFDKNFGYRRQPKPVPHNLLKFLVVIGHPAAFTAEGERRPDNRRQADMIQRGHGIIKIIHGP